MIVRDAVVTAWLTTAKQGETLVYARATALPFGSAVAARMRDLAAQGQVELYRARRHHGAGDENFNYYARRIGKASPSRGQGRAVTGVLPPAPLPPGKVEPQRAGMVRDIAPQVRSMLAEGMAPNACAIARELGLYSAWPVRRALQHIERIAA